MEFCKTNKVPAVLCATGYTEEQIETLFKLGTEATAAATEVTGFTQMWGVLQETAQSGWSKTWKIIFGDLYQAKSMFTPLTIFFSKIKTILYFSDTIRPTRSMEPARSETWATSLNFLKVYLVRVLLS